MSFCLQEYATSAQLSFLRCSFSHCKTLLAHHRTLRLRSECKDFAQLEKCLLTLTCLYLLISPASFSPARPSGLQRLHAATYCRSLFSSFLFLAPPAGGSQLAHLHGRYGILPGRLLSLLICACAVPCPVLTQVVVRSAFPRQLLDLLSIPLQSL